MSLASFSKLPPFPFSNQSEAVEPPDFTFPPCQWLMHYDHSVGELRVVQVFQHQIIYSVPSAYVRASRPVAGGAAVLSGLAEDVVVTVYDASLGPVWSWTD